MVYHVRLDRPRELEPLPWEALYNKGFLATEERWCIIRETPEGLDPFEPWEDRGRPLGILLVMPEGSGLDLAREPRAGHALGVRAGGGGPGRARWGSR